MPHEDHWAVRDSRGRCTAGSDDPLPVSEVAAKYGASVAKETSDPNEAYADWPGEYVPVRLPWPLNSESRS